MTDTLNRRLDRRDMLLVAGSAAAVLPALPKMKDTIQALRVSSLDARDFGVSFDGRSDDAAALQRAVDAAARQQRALALPSGTALMGAPLDLRGRHIGLLGDPAGHTVLRSTAALECLIDAEDEREAIDSPLYIYGLGLDGAATTETGLRVRYRHRTVFDTLVVSRCRTGVDELDTWLSRRTNCRTRDTVTGWRLRGANHSSLWAACSFTNSTAVHLDIGANGTANDGNDALLFQACDIEFGEGDGIFVAAGATATFDTCYIGEGIGGTVLRSGGSVSIRGGALFVGYRKDRVGIDPVAGSVSVSELAIRGQRYGSLDRLLGSSAGGTEPSAGKATFRNIDMQVMVGGNPTFAGDVLGSMPIRSFAPIYGRSWSAAADDATIVETSEQDERRVTCSHVTGPSPRISLAAPLRDLSEARRSSTIYLVIVYSSSKPADVKLTGAGSRVPGLLIGTLPASNMKRTYVKVDVPVEFARYSAVELTMMPAVADHFTLYHATISDSSASDPPPLSNLAKAR